MKSIAYSETLPLVFKVNQAGIKLEYKNALVARHAAKVFNTSVVVGNKGIDVYGVQIWPVTLPYHQILWDLLDEKSVYFPQGKLNKSERKILYATA